MTPSSPASIAPELSSLPGSSVLRNEVQAAALLGVSPRALQKWRVTGGGPQFVRLSARCIRYRDQDLASWTQGRSCRSTSEYAESLP